MRMRQIVKRGAASILVLFLVVSAGGAVWACSNMGPDKHMGMVKAIDLNEGTLTLIDAETGKPLQFATPSHLLKGVRVNDKAVVTFKTELDRMTIKELVIR